MNEYDKEKASTVIAGIGHFNTGDRGHGRLI
jgi:hypothetical protein